MGKENSGSKTQSQPQTVAPSNIKPQTVGNPSGTQMMFKGTYGGDLKVPSGKVIIEKKG